ncbi:hypothetical protein ACH436_18610 [Isoptericola sp. NPDC019693]|uniref:hypothetical protein n=1 Tax=Isoptericola sp. NPDC019693 TaxID=3364009 RepID=UPI003797C5FF
MAVTPDGEHDHVLARAAAGLRELTDEGWVRARASVLDRVLRAVRPSAHVAGRHAGGTFALATALLADRVRAALDDPEGEVRVDDVRCTVGTPGPGAVAGELDAVLVVLSVRFGSRLADTAARVRAAAADAVSAALGADFDARRVTVDLHIADVHPREGAGRPGEGARQPDTSPST